MSIGLVTLFSYRRELIYISLVFILIIIVLPLFALLLLQNIGNDQVSDTIIGTSKNLQEIINNGPYTKPTNGKKGLGFGEREPKVFLRLLPKPHTGVDFPAPIGTPVYAFMKGKVIYVSYIDRGGYGKHIILDHGDGLISIYGHLSKIFVTKDQIVEEGKLIGEVGDTGWSTGPHLHFEVKFNTIPINPEKFINFTPTSQLDRGVYWD